MFIRRVAYIFIFLTALVGAACEKKAEEIKIQAPVLTASGNFELENTSVHTIYNIFDGEGEKFEIKGGLRIGVFEVLISGDSPADFDGLRKQYRENSSYDKVSPRLYYNVFSSQYEAEDFDSLVYLGLLKNFEEIFTYFEDEIGEKGTAVTVPIWISFYGNAVFSKWLGGGVLPAHDNAAYFPLGDAFFILPPILQTQGLPIAFNSGVLAHEFQHRVLSHRLYSGKNFKFWYADLASTTSESVDGLKKMSALAKDISKGIDEGFADIFALGFTGFEDWFSLSLNPDDAIFAAEGEFRNLSGDFAEKVTYEMLTGSKVPTFNKNCGELGYELNEDSMENTRFPNVYCLGVLLAKSIWDASGKDVDKLRSEFLPQINQSFSVLEQTIYDRSLEIDQLEVDMTMVLNAMLSKLSQQNITSYCLQIERKFPSLYKSGEVQCP